MVRDSVKNIFSLTGKTVLITGGAGHLGQAMSEALVAFGAKLFILGHDEGKNKRYADELNLKYPSADCEAIKYDLDDDISIGNALSKVLKRTGRIDVLINNSAYSCAKALHEYEFEEWQKGLSGTINGVFRMVKQVLPIMMKQKSKCVGCQLCRLVYPKEAIEKALKRSKKRNN